MYQAVATNLKLTQNKRNTNVPWSDKKLKEGYSFLIKDYTADVQ